MRVPNRKVMCPASACVSALETAALHRQEDVVLCVLLTCDARRGLADIEAGRTFDADTTIAQRQLRRAVGLKDQALNKARSI